MQTKTLRLLVIVFVLFFVATLVPFVYPYVSKFIKKPAGNANLTPGFEPGNISTVVIRRGVDQVYLSRTDKGWTVNNKEAKADDVNKLLTAFGDMKLSEVVSKNPNNQSQLGVDEFNGYVVQLKGASSDWTVIVGISAGPDSFYIRRSDSSDVYKASGTFRGDLSTTENSWLLTPAPESSTSK